MGNETGLDRIILVTPLNVVLKQDDFFARPVNVTPVSPVPSPTQTRDPNLLPFPSCPASLPIVLALLDCIHGRYMRHLSHKLRLKCAFLLDLLIIYQGANHFSSSARPAKIADAAAPPRKRTIVPVALLCLRLGSNEKRFLEPQATNRGVQNRFRA